MWLSLRMGSGARAGSKRRPGQKRWPGSATWASSRCSFNSKRQRRALIVSAMVYPAVLMVVATSALVFLLTFVVPRLSGVFEDLGAELPLPTRILLAITGALTSGWWAILGAGVLLGVGFQIYRRTEAGAYQIDRLTLRLAILGKVWRK